MTKLLVRECIQIGMKRYLSFFYFIHIQRQGQIFEFLRKILVLEKLYRPNTSLLISCMTKLDNNLRILLKLNRLFNGPFF